MSDTTGPAPAITDEMITLAAEAIEDAALRLLGHDLGVIYRDEIVAAGLRAALDGRTAVERAVLSGVDQERTRQDAKWGEQNHLNTFADGGVLAEAETYAYYAERAQEWKRENAARVEHLNAEGMPSDRNCAWDGILLEEVYEALAEADPARRRTELVQVAAVAVNWVEAIDRRLADESSGDGEQDG